MRYLMGILTAKMVISHNIFRDTIFGQTHLVCILALLTFLMLLVYVCMLYLELSCRPKHLYELE